MAWVMTTTNTSLRISRLVVNQLTCLCDGASTRELSFISAIFVKDSKILLLCNKHL